MQRNPVKPIIFSLLTALAVLTGCLKTPTYNDPLPAHETFTIASRQVNETRTINVWLPPNYAAGHDSLPVMYMPDGGLREDFPHIANTFAELVATNKIPPIIVVGIENTQRRRDLTGPTAVAKDREIAPVVGESAKFRAFISEELFAAINTRYRTTDKKGIMGESLAGLFVTETLLEQPALFDYYLAFDPSLWWNNNYLIRTADARLVAFPPSQKRFWFAGSGAEDISANVSQLANVLATKNLSSLTWQYTDEPKESHGTIFRATKTKALIWTLNAAQPGK